jgi:hypothetical protein
VNKRERTAAKVRLFLNFMDREPDSEPMWMTAGMTLTWGDLRALAEYEGAEEPAIYDLDLNPRMVAIAKAEREERNRREGL